MVFARSAALAAAGMLAIISNQARAQDFYKDKTITEFRAEGEKRGTPIEPLTGTEIESLVSEAYSLTPEQVQRVRAIFGTGKS